MISTANGKLKFIFKEDLIFVKERLLELGILKKTDGVLAIHQYDDPTPHLYNPINRREGTLTIPYGLYENFEENFKSLISSATEAEVECWSAMPFEVIYFKNNKTHKMLGLKSLPFYSSLTKQEIESFDSEAWDDAEASGIDENIYTDDNRDLLNNTVINRALDYMKEKAGL